MQLRKTCFINFSIFDLATLETLYFDTNMIAIESFKKLPSRIVKLKELRMRRCGLSNFPMRYRNIF